VQFVLVSGASADCASNCRKLRILLQNYNCDRVTDYTYLPHYRKQMYMPRPFLQLLHQHKKFKIGLKASNVPRLNNI